MAPREAIAVRTHGVERVRAHLLSALHLGRLRPGERVLSVRKLAGMAGVNPKTVHRAYRELARDGILEVRPGSGTFVTERRTSDPDLPSTPALLEVLARCRADAARLGVSPAELSRFLNLAWDGGVRGTRVGVVECNWEQIAMIVRDLRQGVGLDVEPLTLEQLERDPRAVGRDFRRLVTTDCHYARVKELMGELMGGEGTRIYTVTLDRHFPRMLLDMARRHGLIVVQRDGRFAPVVSALLRQLAGPAGLPPRLRFAEASRAALAFGAAAPGTCAYFSPLVGPEVAEACPTHLRKIEGCWHVEPAAIESLRAGLALELTLDARAV